MAVTRVKKHIDAKIRRERGWSGSKLWIYFNRSDTDVLPTKDKSDLALDLGGKIYVGTISLGTSHPPYLLTNLISADQLRCCT